MCRKLGATSRYTPSRTPHRPTRHNQTPYIMRNKIFTTKEHIHLNLKAKWFDLILDGIKKQEYRDLSDYWKARLNKLFSTESKGNTYIPIVESIIFSNGYAKDRRQFEIEWKGAMIGKGREDWGAQKGKQYYVLQLGNILQSNCSNLA